MTRYAGRAFPKCFRRRNGKLVTRDYYAVTVSAPTLAGILTAHGAPAARDYLRAIAIHEFAHIACYHAKWVHEGHGRRWADLMWAAGETPSRVVDPDNDYDWTEVRSGARAFNGR
jgi:hypothetical protein